MKIYINIMKRGFLQYLLYNNSNNKIYLANIFEKKSTGKEYLTHISLDSLDKWKCKVYVNLKGTSTKLEDLTEIKLKTGEYTEINPGYHTLEFDTPQEILSNEFVVVVEVTVDNGNLARIPLESKVPNSMYSEVEVSNGKCLIGLKDSSNTIEWIKLSEISQINNKLLDGDSTIKAFTTSKKEEKQTEEPKEEEKQTEEPKEEEKNSDFSQAESIIKNAKIFKYTDSSKEEYAEINIEIKDIKRKHLNDKLEYYYYLSNNKNENNITKWVKIKEEQNDENKLIFSINSKDIENFEEISGDKNIYLYIKEVAVKENDKKEFIYVEEVTDIDFEIELYIDDVLAERYKNGQTEKYTYNENHKQNNAPNSTKEENEDGTLANSELPKTGVKEKIIMCIIIISLIGSIGFIRYKNINKYVK